jgi:GAF domain-containing protein
MEQQEKVRQNGNVAEEAQEERKRYIARLSRRVQSQIASDLGAERAPDSSEEPIGTMIQQIMEETGARRVTLYRPIPKGQRWHTATAIVDGGHYYGLVAPEAAVLPMIAYAQRRSIIWSPTSNHEIPTPRPDEFGYDSYVGVPLLKGGEVVAVVEAVDFENADDLDRYVGTIEKRLSSIGAIEAAASDLPTAAPSPPPPPTHGLTEASVLDLVLRPPIDPDAIIEVSPEEWNLLNQLNGERPLEENARAAGVSPAYAISIAAVLLGRGLIKEGREERRRG